ncbi:hypothetical protein chiPu_0019123 [Chiloscyllium punctatum]|uniref:Uncharacterized protein n=1 Tax=Chiloscyllium punctatum TaxID=137246 RepID=A0A401RQQ7_CHIPU|nr:hypothetical protein [Chiloscyllium punctatum]
MELGSAVTWNTLEVLGRHSLETVKFRQGLLRRENDHPKPGTQLWENQLQDLEVKESGLSESFLDPFQKKSHFPFISQLVNLPMWKTLT